MEKRKHALLKNEIEMIQEFLVGDVYPDAKYLIKLHERLENLKREWYKVKTKKWQNKKTQRKAK